jgi:hypothetical protein
MTDEQHETASEDGVEGDGRSGARHQPVPFDVAPELLLF